MSTQRRGGTLYCIYRGEAGDESFRAPRGVQQQCQDESMMGGGRWLRMFLWKNTGRTMEGRKLGPTGEEGA